MFVINTLKTPFLKLTITQTIKGISLNGMLPKLINCTRRLKPNFTIYLRAQSWAKNLIPKGAYEAIDL